MSATGRYGVVRNAFDYDVIDQQNRNARVLKTRSHARAHRECNRLNREHRDAQRAKYVR